WSQTELQVSNDYGYHRWSQGVDATLACSLSAGVRNPKVCRGRVLSLRAISSSSDCENLDRSAFFGRYCRSRPFVFSFEPRCQGLCGSQKETCIADAILKGLCWAISSPRSQVSERRNSAGSWTTCWIRAATTVPVSLPGT